MDLKQLIIFGIENSQEPEIKNPILRAALEGPRITAQEPRMGLAGGQLVQPGPPGVRQGFAESQFQPLTTVTEKAYYKKLYGKKYNVDDWRSGNFSLKEEFSSGKKKAKRMPGQLRVDFKKSLSQYLSRASELNKLTKGGYMSIGQLNAKLGRKDTQDAIDGLERALSGERTSPWLDEIPGVKKWKKSRIGTGSEFMKIEGGGKVFYKMPDKETLKGLKSYYKNQEYLSDFKQGRIRGNTIKNVQVLYDDETLMKAIKKWTVKDKKVPLTIIKGLFGDGMTGPNAVMQLGKALKGDIKVPGVRKNAALGNKIIDAMSWEAGKKRGPWQSAMYEYARGEMDNLYKLHGKEWSFGKYYNETRNLLTKLGVKDVIDEVSSLRSGWSNNNQIYSNFKQVIDKKINDSFKSGYDGHFSQSQFKVQEALKKGDYEEVARLTELQQGSYKRAKLKYPKVEFATFGEFDKATGKFAKPADVFGKRFTELPSQIQKGIRKSYRETGVSLNVGQAKTQQELYQSTKELSSLGEKEQAKLLQKLGYGKHCKASGGRVGFANAGDVGAGQMKCIMSDVEKTRADMKSSDVTVRAKALTKQRKVLQLASKIGPLKKILKTGIQMGTAAVTKPLEWLGLTSGIGYAIEGIVEGGFYDNARRKGYSHEQAMAETFTPGLIAGRPHDVPWYGGSEKLREKELYEIKGRNEFIDVENRPPMQDPEFEKVVGTKGKVKQYIDALKEQDRIYETIGAKEEAKADLELAETGFDATLLPGDLDAASADVQDLARSGAYRRVDKTLDPESMASQAYNTAVESQQALDQRRRREYLEKYDPGALEREQKSFDIYARDQEGEILYEKPQSMYKKRYKEMDKMYPDYSKEDIDYILKNMWGTSMEELGEGYTYENIGKWFKDKDKSAHFAENFRMEKAQGGIMNLKKKW